MRCFAILWLLPFTASAAAPAWNVAARESWVQAAPAGTTPPLHDRQIRLTAAGDDRYEHTLLPLMAEQTGENASQLTVTLDPRYQGLVIHSLKLTRAAGGTQVFTAAQIRERVRTQAALADAHQLELNPRLQLSVQIPESQPGDVLECEYTVHSLTARLPGLIADHYAAQWPGGAEQPLALGTAARAMAHRPWLAITG